MHRARRLDALRRVAEHRRRDERLVDGVRHPRVDHPADGAGRLDEDPAADPVQTADVHDRRHHRDVFHADEPAHVAARERGHHELRNAEWERAHRGGPYRGARTAAQAEHAGDPTFRVQPEDHGARAFHHRRDGVAAVRLGDERRDGRAAGRGHFVARDVCRERGLTEHAGIDDEDALAVLFDLVFDEFDFGALGIKSAHDNYRRGRCDARPRTRFCHDMVQLCQHVTTGVA